MRTTNHATAAMGRLRAKRQYPNVEPCADCGVTGVLIDRHHIDGNTLNNQRENIAFLCRRCHMVRDGRLAEAAGRAAAVAQLARTEPSPCRQCARVAKPLRGGLCSRCYDRKRKPARYTKAERSEIHRAVIRRLIADGKIGGKCGKNYPKPKADPDSVAADWKQAQAGE
jgi:hypothetical protein